MSEERREWLIWSMEWGRWHRRSSDGKASGYTAELTEAGLFTAAEALAVAPPRNRRNRKVNLATQVGRLTENRDKLLGQLAALEAMLAVGMGHPLNRI